MISKSLKDLEKIRILGRTSEIRENTPLFSALSGLEMLFLGRNLYLDVEVDYNVSEPWICVEVNGERIIRMPLQKGRQKIQILRGFSVTTRNYIRIFKDTQEMPDDPAHEIIIHGIDYDGSFLELPKKKLNIEFIGDSLTSGEGIIGASYQSDWIPSFFDPYLSYERIVSDNLNADFRIISQSGWGVVCGYNNDKALSIPRVYTKTRTSQVLAGKFLYEDYDFSWKTDVVIINLGTNDNTAFNSPAFENTETGEIFKLRMDENEKNHDDVCLFIEKVESFIRLVRDKNKDAKIVWTYGMLGCDLIEEIKSAVKNINSEGDRQVYFLKLPDTADDEFGSLQHPGKISHQNSAEVITEFLKSLLKV